MNSIRFAVATFVVSTAVQGLSTAVHAHFPWLSTDEQGHAIMWFGESTADRTYSMPAAVQAIELGCGSGTDKDSFNKCETIAVKSNDLVGIRSKAPVNENGEVAGTVTYGLYHGTKLTYHVEHLPNRDAKQWPAEPRADSPMQTIITAKDGGVSVLVLKEGKPLADTNVKLFCEKGHEEASRSTDAQGTVTFTSKEVEAGLNAVVVGSTDEDAKGEFNGEGYGSTTEYLTATFFSPSASETRRVEPKRKTSKPAPASFDKGVSVVPARLPALPEELTSFGAAIAGKTLYVYGGHTGNAHSYSTEEQSNRFWSLDLSGGQDVEWVSRPSGPRLQGLALVAYRDSLIRIGGFTAENAVGEEHDLHSKTLVAKFDPTAGKWTSLPPLPEARSSLDAAVLGSTVYVFGGWQLSGDQGDPLWHQTGWMLDLNGVKSGWKATANPPFQRRAISVAAHAGKIYVIGGMRPKQGPTTRVDVYDPTSDSWQQAPALPGSGMSGFGSSAFAVNGQLYVSTMDGLVHRLDQDSAGWTSVAKCDRERFFHRMLTMNDHELLMVGGANMEVGKFVDLDVIRIAEKD